MKQKGFTLTIGIIVSAVALTGSVLAFAGWFSTADTNIRDDVSEIKVDVAQNRTTIEIMQEQSLDNQKEIIELLNKL